MAAGRHQSNDRMGPVVAVCADPANDEPLLRAAARLAVDLDLPLLDRPRVRGVDVLLVVTPARLELRVVGGEKSLRGGRAVFSDLTKLDTQSPAGRRLRQPIARAVGLGKGRPPPAVIDATGGWGEDAWLLASLGCQVLCLERYKVIAAMLQDAVIRAMVQEADTAARLHITAVNAAPLLRRMAAKASGAADKLPAAMALFCPPQVVYLDPMFPAARKAAERKPMRLLRWLVGDDDDAGDLLAAAMRVAEQRVVVKRPLKAEPLGPKPTTSHKGQATRYDVYLVGK